MPAVSNTVRFYQSLANRPAPSKTVDDSSIHKASVAGAQKAAAISVDSTAVPGVAKPANPHRFSTQPSPTPAARYNQIRPNRWASDYQQLVKDSNTIRTVGDDAKGFFFDAYNLGIGKRFSTPISAFNVWANALAYVHPAKNQSVVLNVGEHSGYAKEYVFAKSIVDPSAELVAHILEPKDGDGRMVVMFRGTSPNPATYTSEKTGERLVEPTGIIPDVDPTGVGRMSYRKVQDQVEAAIAEHGGARRGVTFIGHSLGGAFAQRALKYHYTKTKSQNFDLFVYSSAGLDWYTAYWIDHTFNPRSHTSGKRQINEKLHSVWHEDDIVPKTASLPRMNGEMVTRKQTGEFRILSGESYLGGELERHLLPFVSIHDAWDKSVNIVPSTRPTHHMLSNFFREYIVRRSALVTGVGVLTSWAIHQEKEKSVRAALTAPMWTLSGR